MYFSISVGHFTGNIQSWADNGLSAGIYALTMKNAASLIKDDITNEERLDTRTQEYPNIGSSQE